MTWSSALPVLVILSSLGPGLVIFGLAEHRTRERTALNVAAALTKLGLVGIILVGVLRGEQFQARIPFVPGADLLLRVDSFALLFVSLSTVLWLVTTIYAVGYLEGSTQRSRFFGFFSLSVSATMGIAMAGNLLTFFVFYELLTIATYPLVVHEGTPAALRAGTTYLRYTFFGGALLLVGTAALYVTVGSIDFVDGGVLRSAAESSSRATLVFIFVLLLAGLSVKAAVVPFHGWLPAAMVAPAPVSALLHAVAVVKAGAFGITRVIYEVYGIRVAARLGLMRPVVVIAAVTIIYGSLKALAQHDLKRRLAYSTVSQVSYIVLGTALVGTISTVGAVVHLVHQGLMKVTLFFCAGNLAHELHIHDVREMRGVARRMPLTMLAFTLASLGMIGIPPLAGFITKWYLGAGALEAHAPWVIVVLLASSLLNAAYLLPIVYDAWFREPRTEWPGRTGGREIDGWLLGPTLTAAALALAAGVFAGTSLSPLGWAIRIAREEFTG
ncbi:MAG TPA: proton-conducting transporter membrane subunit [Kofleriaceae bacterium]|nr:proton-conducting transporter membrane subunit [Kofleriaceae bacterium]